jgi:hypothetical protein
MLPILQQRLCMLCKQVICLLFGFIFFASVYSQNDNCSAATVINIPNNGFQYGTFLSPSSDLSAATLETGENFAPPIITAGLDQKSVWYKFTLPTTRYIDVSLVQTGSIPSGDVGFAVYKTSGCLPTGTNLSPDLLPRTSFGNTFSNCVSAGTYLIQVSS